jgi:BASS family bile acid:Na+ symporter
MSMFTLMLGMGLTLQGDDFRRIATSPRATLVGTVLQLLVMPIVGMAIARFFGLSQVLSSGIVVLAACPGGMFSNMMVHLARGNTALSVTLTATATLVTLFTLPLWYGTGRHARDRYGASTGDAHDLAHRDRHGVARTLA